MRTFMESIVRCKGNFQVRLLFDAAHIRTKNRLIVSPFTATSMQPWLWFYREYAKRMAQVHVINVKSFIAQVTRRRARRDAARNMYYRTKIIDSDVDHFWLLCNRIRIRIQNIQNIWATSNDVSISKSTRFWAQLCTNGSVQFQFLGCIK